MADGFLEALFGTNAGTEARKDLYNKFTNYDNRMADVNNIAGGYLNSLANRGIVNSSVTSRAMADAINQADKRYYDTLYQAGNFLPQDSVGLVGGMLGGLAGGFGSGLGKATGNWLGGLFSK